MSKLYHAVYLKNDACIRPMEEGISNIEWHHGVRIFQSEVTNQVQLHKILLQKGFFVAYKEHWSDIIKELDDPNIVTSNSFKNTKVVIDKWDSNRTVY